jgi:hypothetical protein
MEKLFLWIGEKYELQEKEKIINHHSAQKKKTEER